MKRSHLGYVAVSLREKARYVLLHVIKHRHCLVPQPLPEGSCPSSAAKTTSGNQHMKKQGPPLWYLVTAEASGREAQAQGHKPKSQLQPEGMPGGARGVWGAAYATGVTLEVPRGLQPQADT